MKRAVYRIGLSITALALSGVVHAECLTLRHTLSGGVDTAVVANDCPEEISFTYCLTSSTPNGPFDCNAQHFGEDHVGPNSTRAISVSGSLPDRSVDIQFASCVWRKPNDPTYESRVYQPKFESGKLWGYRCYQPS